MKYNIAVLPGDGIGPEVIDQALKVLNVLAEHSELEFEYAFCPIGASSIIETGEALTQETIHECLLSDAILFGAIGDPAYDNNPDLKVRPEQGLLRLRKETGLFANIRPVVAYEALLPFSPLKKERVAGVDLVIYRELTSGIYFGDKGSDDSGAFDVCRYERFEVERILKLAFEAAAQRRNRLTLVDKANVMETSRLWRKVAQEMHMDYPLVDLDFLFVDNAAMQLVLNPKQFDVIVTSNMFGDILSDEASVIAGSLGLLPSSSIGEKTALFEPIHGSYPQAAGLNVANPLGTILAAAMMMDHLNEKWAGDLIRRAVGKSLRSGIMTADLNPDHAVGTSEVGKFVAEEITRLLTEKIAVS